MHKTINLAMLNKSNVEMIEKEMNATKAGTAGTGVPGSCVCLEGCKKSTLVMVEVDDASYWHDYFCDCGLWSTFGMM